MGRNKFLVTGTKCDAKDPAAEIDGVKSAQVVRVKSLALTNSAEDKEERDGNTRRKDDVVVARAEDPAIEQAENAVHDEIHAIRVLNKAYAKSRQSAVSVRSGKSTRSEPNR